MRTSTLWTLVIALFASPAAAEGRWAAPITPVIPEADGYVAIPGAAVQPRPGRIFRAVFDATRGGDTATQLVPALNMAGSELNVLVGAGLPLRNAKFVIVFHGAAIQGILDDDAYQAKFGVPNPNRKLIQSLHQAGVKLFVCGQNLAFEDIDPKTLVPEVKVALDALIVLMQYQLDGYALINF